MMLSIYSYTCWYLLVNLICFPNPRKKVCYARDTWVVQSVKHPTSAQIMISELVSLSPTSGSVLTARSLKPASDSVSPSLSAPLLLTLSKINIKKKKKSVPDKNFPSAKIHHPCWSHSFCSNTFHCKSINPHLIHINVIQVKTGQHHWPNSS